MRRRKPFLMESHLAIALALVLGSHAHAVELLDPAGPNAAMIAGVFWMVVAICSVIFASVACTIVYFVVRFRERIDDGENEPPQIYGSEPMEVAWTLAPAMIVMILGLVTVRSILELRTIPHGDDSERVRVVGHQWWWEFDYPQYGFTTANEMVIPASEADRARQIALQLESADVIHSFWVPKLAGKTDNIPGHTNRMWIEATTPATYFGRCAEYCGTQHTKMLFRVEAVSDAEYRKWIEEQQRPAVDDPAAHEGKALFLSMACANCHRIRGTAARGTYGPDLTHLMSRKTLGSAIVENNRENLTKWVDDPDSFKPKCNMPDMRMTDEETRQIIDYLITLE